MDITTVIVVGIIVAAGIWVHKVGTKAALQTVRNDLTKATVEIKSHFDKKSGGGTGATGA